MLNNHRLSTLCLATTLLASGSGHAEDIELFLSSAKASASANAVFVIDNGASWNANIGTMKKNEMVLDALHGVVTNEEFREKVNLGMMTMVKSPKGGEVFVHAESLTASRQAYLSCRIYATTPDPVTGICPAQIGKEALYQGATSPYGLSMYETYLYYSGKTPVAGLQNGVYTASNTSGYDSAALDADGTYASPAHTTKCVDNYIIVIGTGDPDSGENNSALAALKSVNGWMATDPVLLTNNLYQSSWGDEFARFMRSTDVDPDTDGTQSVITYVIDVFEPGGTTKSFKSARDFYQSIAKQGRGKYFTAQNKEEVVTALKTILTEIQAVNSVFASVSLPISVNVQGAHQNEVYIGMFRPASTRVPRWLGNIKRYQYALSGNGDPYLADATGAAAYNPATGFISPTAVSYWTHASDYWGFIEDYDSSDSPDGDLVEKGAAAQMLRDLSVHSDRKVYTCGDTCLSTKTLDVFDSNNSGVKGALSDKVTIATTEYSEEEIINWVRGMDVFDGNLDGNKDDIRFDVHGDVLHSRPAAINYGDTDGNTIVFYGTNDGIFHAMDGKTGNELWGFIAQEHYADLETLFINEKSVDPAPWRPYFFDGNPTVVQHDGKIYLYLTMRRGGRTIYALDVTSKDSPKLLWRKNSSDITELGQTWSTPTAAYVKGSTNPVLIFGLGYDPSADDDGAGRTMGRGIIMLDALDGHTYWQAGVNPGSADNTKTIPAMKYSIPSDVKLMNYSGSKYAEAIYVGDTGGNLWRVDISKDDPNNWTVRKVASDGGTGSNDRRFLYPPSIVMTESYDAVLIGSGNREDPLETVVDNRFYMFKVVRSDTDTIAMNEMLDVTGYTAATIPTTTLDSKRGWYFDLTGPGEKVTGNAVTLRSKTMFYTNIPKQPSATSCESDLGTAREYMVDYLSGVAMETRGDVRYRELKGGGFPPPPSTITLKFDDVTKTFPAALDPPNPGDYSEGRRQRSFWFKKRE